MVRLETHTLVSDNGRFLVLSIAAQRAEIRNLASALAEQNDELERLNDDLTQMSRGPVHTQYLHNPGQFLKAVFILKYRKKLNFLDRVAHSPRRLGPLHQNFINSNFIIYIEIHV